MDSLLKILQPKETSTLAYILYSDNRTNKLVDKLEGAKLSPQFATIVSSIQDGRLTLESILDKMPNPDFPKEQAQANLDKIMDVASNTTRDTRDKSLEETLLEAINLSVKVSSYRTDSSNADEAKLEQLKQKIKELLPKSERSERRNTKTKTLLNFLERLEDKFTITFNNIPEDKENFLKILEKVAKIVVEERMIKGEKKTIYLGRVTGDKLLTNFENASEFLKFIDENQEKGKEIRENLAEFEPNLGNVSLVRTKKKKRKQVSKEILENLVARGVSFTPSTITSFQDVQDYLDAIERVPYDITPLIPRSLSVSESASTRLPPTFFLTRASTKNLKSKRGQKSLVLNPYVRVLLQSTYTEANWFQNFFDDVRVGQIIQQNLASLMVLDDIYDMLKLNKESKYGFTRTRFGSIELGNRESGRVKIKQIIGEDDRLGDAFSSQISNIRRNLLLELQTDFLIDEAYDLQEAWEGNEDLKDFEGDLEVIPKDDRYATIQVDGRNVDYSEVMEKLTENGVSYNPSTFRELIQNTIETEGDDNQFIQYILSLDKAELTNIVSGQIEDSAKFMDKLNAKNSLIFLSRVSERMLGDNEDLVANALEAIANEESVAQKQKLALELNGKMKAFLEELKDIVFSSFQRELEDFATNYIRIAGRSPDKAIRAIKAFISKGLLSGDLFGL